MGTNTEHDCVATHCVVCCPSAKAYSEGVQFGKDFYSGLHSLTLNPTDIARMIIVTVILTTLVVMIAYKYRNRSHEISS